MQGMTATNENQIISIHALREEGDPWSCRCRQERPEFLSTPSARRATSPPPGLCL